MVDGILKKRKKTLVETNPRHEKEAFSIEGGEEETEEERDYIPSIEEWAIDWNDEIFGVHSTRPKLMVACWALTLLLVIFVLSSLALLPKAPNDIVNRVKSFSLQYEEGEDASSGASEGYYQPFEPPENIELQEISSSEKTHNRKNDSKKNSGGVFQERPPTRKGAKESQQGDDEIVKDEYDQVGDDNEVDADDHTENANKSNPVDDGVVYDDYEDEDVSNSPLPVDNEASKKDENKNKGQEETNGDNHDNEDLKEEEPLDFTPTELLPPGNSSNARNCIYTPGVAMEEDPFEIAKGDWAWDPLTMHDSSPPPDDPVCSCWNNTAACCERGIHPNHKFGHHMLRDLFGDHPKHPMKNKYYFGDLVSETTANEIAGTRQFRYPPEYFHRPGNVDYREIFVWRNTYEAMVSGYLYHKAGSECWLNGFGKSDKQSGTHYKPVQDSWMLNPAPHVPAEKREICQYLVDESEYDGMRVYVEFVVRRYYVTTINIYKAVQLYEGPRHRRTLFVCFEDLNSNVQATKEGVIRRMIAWMFPGGQHADAPAPEAVEYVGLHATDNDAVQRQRLYNIVKQLDDEVFGGTLRNLNEMFGNCGGKV